MDIPRKIRRNWEARFPDFYGEWSHWKISGGGVLIAVIHGMDLFDALDVVEDNFEKYSSIKVNLVSVSPDGSIKKEDSHVTEVSNNINDMYLIEKYRDEQA